MWASLDLPSRTPQRTPAQTPASSPHETQPARPPLPQPTSVFTVAHLASYHLTSFLRPVVLIFVPGCCCCYCSATVASGESGQFPPAVGASSAARSRASQSVTTLLLLGRAKEGLPGSPHTILFNSTTHHPLHVTTALQWPSTIVPDASCTHAPTSSPHSRPNTLVAPRCCPPVPPCLSSVAAARLAGILH